MTFSAYSGSGLKQAITHKPRFDFTDIVDGGKGELRHCVVPADVVRLYPGSDGSGNLHRQPAQLV